MRQQTTGTGAANKQLVSRLVDRWPFRPADGAAASAAHAAKRARHRRHATRHLTVPPVACLACFAPARGAPNTQLVQLNPLITGTTYPLGATLGDSVGGAAYAHVGEVLGLPGASNNSHLFLVPDASDSTVHCIAVGPPGVEAGTAWMSVVSRDTQVSSLVTPPIGGGISALRIDMVSGTLAGTHGVSLVLAVEVRTEPALFALADGSTRTSGCPWQRLPMRGILNSRQGPSARCRYRTPQAVRRFRSRLAHHWNSRIAKTWSAFTHAGVLAATPCGLRTTPGASPTTTFGARTRTRSPRAVLASCSPSSLSRRFRSASQARMGDASCLLRVSLSSSWIPQTGYAARLTLSRKTRSRYVWTSAASGFTTSDRQLPSIGTPAAHYGRCAAPTAPGAAICNVARRCRCAARALRDRAARVARPASSSGRQCPSIAVGSSAYGRSDRVHSRLPAASRSAEALRLLALQPM